MILLHAGGVPSKRPSGVTTIHSFSSKAIKLTSSLPELISHTLILVSQLPLTRYLLFGLNTTELTRSECSLRVRSSAPLDTSHSLTVLSQLPLARVFPSGLNATEITSSEWPVSVRNSRPVVTSHSLIAL